MQVGGGSKCVYGQVIGCHFSQNYDIGSKILDFFNAKFYHLISNLNGNFNEAFFEVYCISVSQKLTILELPPKIFFNLALAKLKPPETKLLASATSLRFNFFLILFVLLVSKFQRPETIICHRDTLTPSPPQCDKCWSFVPRQILSSKSTSKNAPENLNNQNKLF